MAIRCLYNHPLSPSLSHLFHSQKQHQLRDHNQTTITTRHTNSFFVKLLHHNNQSSWTPSSRPATTSLTRCPAPPTVFPRRPTRTLPRTTRPASALVSKPPAMPSRTRPRSTRTTPRPRPTSRPPLTKSTPLVTSANNELSSVLSLGFCYMT
ncbi:hypothetical protein VTG60DRAFT_887 [Thermothelomyces hinnuleus]